MAYKTATKQKWVESVNIRSSTVAKRLQTTKTAAWEVIRKTMASKGYVWTVHYLALSFPLSYDLWFMMNCENIRLTSELFAIRLKKYFGMYMFYVLYNAEILLFWSCACKINRVISSIEFAGFYGRNLNITQICWKYLNSSGIKMKAQNYARNSKC